MFVTTIPLEWVFLWEKGLEARFSSGLRAGNCDSSGI